MKEFTLDIYKQLLVLLKSKDYSFQTFRDFYLNKNERVVVLRHDVDRLPENAVDMGRIENELNINATYYFRSVQSVFKPEIISKVKDLGHEIGYHYEDLTLAKGDPDKAIKIFEKNLAAFNAIAKIETICMHGSPLTSWDNRDIWKKYNYRDYGIIAEPYFDVDYNSTCYITDTGRKWNNTDSNVRDRVESSYNLIIKDTYDFLDQVEKNGLPEKIIINTHPHRWFSGGIKWYRELAGQNLKNVAKSALLKVRKK